MGKRLNVVHETKLYIITILSIVDFLEQNVRICITLVFTFQMADKDIKKVLSYIEKKWSKFN